MAGNFCFFPTQDGAGTQATAFLLGGEGQAQPQTFQKDREDLSGFWMDRPSFCEGGVQRALVGHAALSLMVEVIILMCM